MLIRLLRLIRGYVRFEIVSPYPERFLNLSVRRQIPVWDTVRDKESIFASMYNRDYRRIRPCARGAQARLSIRERHGLPVAVRKYRGRFGVALGALAFLLTVFVMSQFIWSVEITGLDRISESKMREELCEEGLFVGAFKPSLDFSEIARNVMIRDKDVGWMAVNVTGSYASVELKEEQLPPAVENIYEPCNIKASQDGVIIKAQVREGELLLSEGSGVVEGQLLVSGVLKDALSGSSFVHSDAKLLAQTVRSQSFSLSKTDEALLPEEQSKERKKLCFLGLEIPLQLVSPSSSDYAVRNSCACLRFLDVDIPVGIVLERLRGFTEEQRSISEQKAQVILRQKADLYEAFCLSDCTVNDREYVLSALGEEYRLDVTYHCTEDIAVKSPIYLEEEP